MSLRMRLVLSLALVLAVTLAAGIGLAGLHAATSVRTELQAALDAGRQTAVNTARDAAGSPAAIDELRHFIATFDGNRHVRARLIAPDGATLAASEPRHPDNDVPAWFQYALDPGLEPAVVAAAGTRVVLSAESRNEIGEVLDQANDAVRTLGLFFLLAVALIYWTIGRALAPLARLSAAFGQIGRGEYGVRLDRTGPPELAVVAGGFNRMAEQLGHAEAQNRRLQEQLLNLQDEERADLARDLHDEIGPLLFGAGIDAASIRPLLDADRTADAAERADAIGQSIARIQAEIRVILRRLRPLSFGSVGLAEAIGNLASSWRQRHPKITFIMDVTGDDETLAEPIRATICRVVQESLFNAVRHGAPGRVEINVRREADHIVVRVTDDGSGPGDGGLTPGFGLTGMRERVLAQSGTLAVAAPSGGRGLEVTARLPYDLAA